MLFIAVPTNIENFNFFSYICLCTFLVKQLYSYMHSRKYVQLLTAAHAAFFAQAAEDNSMAMIRWPCYTEIMSYEQSCLLQCFIIYHLSYCMKILQEKLLGYSYSRGQ